MLLSPGAGRPAGVRAHGKGSGVQPAADQGPVGAPDPPAAVKGHHQDRYVAPRQARRPRYETVPRPLALAADPGVDLFGAGPVQEVGDKHRLQILTQRRGVRVQSLGTHDRYGVRMPDPVKQANGEQSVALMLQHAQQLLADWVTDLPGLDAKLLERLDLALGRQVWHAHVDENSQIEALGAALLGGRTLSVALEQYIGAKLDAAADDLLDT